MTSRHVGLKVTSFARTIQVDGQTISLFSCWKALHIIAILVQSHWGCTVLGPVCSWRSKLQRSGKNVALFVTYCRTSGNNTAGCRFQLEEDTLHVCLSAVWKWATSRFDKRDFKIATGPYIPYSISIPCVLPSGWRFKLFFLLLLIGSYK
jgi:hypothetical protein